VVRDKANEKAIELQRIKVGLANGNTIEVLNGLAPGDRVVTRGGLFIDRVAAAGG
jgi:cobalt-zinc-cadmium efflux system membrane fusion protein